ncbi:hypothetical protein C3F09_04215, partial [candidate division GN15 bacterium]
MNRMLLKLTLAVVLLLGLAGAALPQSSTFFNQRDDEYRLLGLKRAKEAYEVARAEFDRQNELFKRGLITQSELDRAHNVFSDAEVNYQQSLLAVLFEQQFVSVVGAVKYHAKDGGRKVKLTLANMSSGGEEFQKLINIDDKLFRSLQPDVISNVYVSLFNDQNAIISQPYEIKIPELRSGSPQTIDFSLMQELDAVTVSIIYGRGSQRTMKIFLQKDVSVNKVAVQSEQFSQEVDLGNSASYDLTLELFSGSENTFALEAVNLPQEIIRNFKDAANQARLSQVKFTESSTSKRALLEIQMPDRPTATVAMDQPITFYVVALPADRTARPDDLTTRTWTENEIAALGVGYAKLELLPRGRGRLLVRSPQLYHSIEEGGTVEVLMDVVNEGSRRLDNITLTADVPLNWTKQIEPATIPALQIGEESRVKLTFKPADDVAAGKYEVRVRFDGTSGGQPV